MMNLKFNRQLLCLALFSASAVCSAKVTLVDKPADVLPKIKLLEQKEIESYPKDAKEVFFKETLPSFSPAPWEKQCGMALFSRPLTHPVWPNSNMQSYERIGSLAGWGARKQFVTLNLVVLPLQNLKDLQIRVRNCKEMPELRLVRYWDIVYPHYNALRSDPKNKRYRKTPELLVPFSSMDAPKGVPQRFLFTFQLPADGRKKVTGDIIVSHAGINKALKVPFSIDVLPFELKRDPNKHYSAYYLQVRRPDSRFYRLHKNDPELLKKVQRHEFRRMLEYGFTRPPTIRGDIGTLPDGTKDSFRVVHIKEFAEDLRAAGFPADAAIPVINMPYVELYEKYSGHKLSSWHLDNIRCDLIPKALYDYVGSALDKFLAYAKKNDLPPMIFAPIDEPAPAAWPFVTNFYKEYKKRGLTTFMTSPPELMDDSGKVIDIFNYAAFNVDYQTAVSGKKKEYWCYPNDNAYQIKDPSVMCHGGRMTYGVGFWRSGFHCLLPWIWRGLSQRRIWNSGGNMLLDDGTLYMTMYWECFRLGVDDLRYIYTLQDAIVKRQNSRDPRVKKAVSDAKKLLQQIWDHVAPQPAYLREKLMPHAELDGWRALAAREILKLMKFPETSKAASPSVIVDPKGKYRPMPETAGGKNFMVHKLENWIPIAKELTMKKQGSAMDLVVKIDHKFEGEYYGGKKHYPIGWPRIRTHFDPVKGLDLTKFSYVEFDLTVSSDRNIEEDYKWVLSINASSHKKEVCEFAFSTRLEPGIRHKIRIPVSRFTMSREALKHLKAMQIFIFEVHYPHGCTLKLKIENPRLTGFSAPTVLKIEAPRVLALPVNGFSVPVEIAGLPENRGSFTAFLVDAQNKIVQRTAGKIIDAKGSCGFKGAGLKCGTYTVKIKIPGMKEDSLTGKIRVIAAPAAGPR